MKALRGLRTIALALLLIMPMPMARAAWPGGVGVLGDSYSDEYRFYPPHRSTALNWVEILAEVRGMNFGAFSESSRGEPRNQGFAYNWARSDAESDDMIARGQHTGLAEQVKRGEVSLVVIFIGGNDFIHAMKGPDPVAALSAVGPRAERNLERALTTILGAHPDVKVVLVTVPDIRGLPEFREPLRDGRLPREHAEAATEVIRRYNARMKLRAARESRVAVLDFDLMTKLTERLYPETLIVGGRSIERWRLGDDAGHLFLGDVRHLGTVGQGLFASLLVATINAKFNTGIAPLSEREIVALAAKHSGTPAPVVAAAPARGIHESKVTQLLTRLPAWLPNREARITPAPSTLADAGQGRRPVKGY